LKENSARQTSNGVLKKICSNPNEGIEIIQSPNSREIIVKALKRS
jgi:hypothetical protein